MHIPDGILPAQVWASGYALTGLTTWFSLRQIRRRADSSNAEMPKASLLTAAFFVASSIRIPMPFASVHFVLNGLLGAILGYYAFPAILVGLFFQAIVFAHGGLTTLGIDAVMMGIPALLSGFIFRQYRHFAHWLGDRVSMGVFAFLAGSGGIGLAVLIFFGLVVTSIPEGFNVAQEQAAITLLVTAHVPLILLEGIFTVLLVLFLRQVKPELLPLVREKNNPTVQDSLGTQFPSSIR